MVQKCLPYLLLSADNNSLNNFEPENARKTATRLWAELRIGIGYMEKTLYTDLF